jgi:hypothetical protein
LHVTGDAVKVSRRPEPTGAVKVGIGDEIVELEPDASVRREL